MTAPSAYLFWHRPRRSTSPDAYRSTLAAFHRALAADPPEGFSTSWTWRLDEPPWLPGTGPAFLDAYLVRDLAALELLEAGAVSGSRRASHDDAASAAAEGSGGLSLLVAGSARPDGVTHLAYLDKPAGADRDRFVAGLAGPGRSVWMRRMVLGAGPEYLVAGDRPFQGAATDGPRWATPVRDLIAP